MPGEWGRRWKWFPETSGGFHSKKVSSGLAPVSEEEVAKAARHFSLAVSVSCGWRGVAKCFLHLRESASLHPWAKERRASHSQEN